MSRHTSRRWPFAVLLPSALAAGCVFDSRSIAVLGGDGWARADGRSSLVDAAPVPGEVAGGGERSLSDGPRKSAERNEHPKLDLPRLDLPRPEYLRPCEASYGDEPGFQLCGSDPTSCTFFMDPPGNSKRSCADACGAGCLAAKDVDPASATCTPVGNQTCSAAAKSLICVCRR